MTREHGKQFGLDAASFVEGVSHVGVEAKTSTSLHPTSKHFTDSFQAIGFPSRERDWYREVDLRVKQIASGFSMLISTRHFHSESN